MAVYGFAQRGLWAGQGLWPAFVPESVPLSYLCMALGLEVGEPRSQQEEPSLGRAKGRSGL